MTSPAVEHRGWSLRMILWSAGLAALLLFAAWATVNWRSFHQSYCRHLIRSSDPETSDRGAYMVLKSHVRPGMTREEIDRLLKPRKVGIKANERVGTFYLRTEPDGYNFALLVFDDDNRLEKCEFVRPWSTAD